MTHEHGVHITEGPRHYRILQQQNGSAVVSLSGTYGNCEQFHNLIEPVIYARAVWESDGRTAVDWTRMEALPESRWRGSLRLPAGGPYRIDTCMDHTGQRIEWSLKGDCLRHIGVGDLFVIAGQSNAVGYGKDPVEDPPMFGVHLLRNDGTWDIATHPLGDNTGSIHIVNNEAANCGHSPWLCFARQISCALHTPVGLIQSALGGSALENWSPDKPDGLYASMINSVRAAGGRVKGMLWYQGETDAYLGNEQYTEQFLAFVQAFRRDTGNPQCPVLTVQLNHNLEASQPARERHWNAIREAQRQAALRDSHVLIIPPFGAEMADALHNSARGNLIIGRRAADCILEKVYRLPYRGTAPDVVNAVETPGNRIRLSFTHVIGRMDVLGAEDADRIFRVEDGNGNVPLTHWTGEGSTITLFAGRALKGEVRVSAMEGMHFLGVPPMDMGSGLPMLAFRGLAVKRL